LELLAFLGGMEMGRGREICIIEAEVRIKESSASVLVALHSEGAG